MRIKGKGPSNGMRVRAQECVEPQQSVANLFRPNASTGCTRRRASRQRSPCGQEAGPSDNFPARDCRHLEETTFFCKVLAINFSNSARFSCLIVAAE